MLIFSSVTEVVWEGEDTETKKADNVTTKKDDKTATTNPVNRLELILHIHALQTSRYKFLLIDLLTGSSQYFWAQ